MKKLNSAQTAASEFEVLEPRVMLDATGVLGWTLDADSSASLDQVDIISSMSALYESFEAEFDADKSGSILQVLQGRLTEALEGVEDLFTLEEGQEKTRFGDLEDTFERVRISAMAVVDQYKADLGALITANLNDVITKALNTYDVTPALDSSIGGTTQGTLDDLLPPDAAVDPNVADPNYLTFTDPLTGDVTEFFKPNLVETKAEVPFVAATYEADGTTIKTPEVPLEPAEYGFDGYSTDGDFILLSILEGANYLTAMQGDADLFSDDLTVNIRAFIAALGDVSVDSPTGDFAVGSGIEVGKDTVVDPEMNDSTRTPATGNVFSDAELDDLAKYFTVYIRTDNNALGAELDLDDAQGYATVNGSVIRSIGLTDSDGNAIADIGVPDPALNPQHEIWQYLTSEKVLEQVITQEALFESADDVTDEAVFRGNLIKRIDDFLDAVVIELGDVNNGVIENLAPVAGGLTDRAKDYIRGLWSHSLETTLNALPASGNTEMEALQNHYVPPPPPTSTTPPPGTTSPPSNKLTVTTAMPFFDTLLDELDLDGKLRSTLPVDFEFAKTQTNLSFTLEAVTTGTSSVELIVGEFKLDNDGALFEFGAANSDFELFGTAISGINHVTGLSSDAELPFGFLSANLTGISTGQIGLYTDFMGTDSMGGSANLGREIVFDIDTFQMDPTADKATEAAITTSGDNFVFETKAQAVDSNDVITIADLKNNGVAPDQINGVALDLIRYDFEAFLPTDFIDAAPGSFSSVDVELVQNVLINKDFGFTRESDETFDTTFTGTSVQFGFPALGTSLGSGVGNVYEALFFTSPLMISEFFSSIGSGVADLLTQEDFSVPVPMTDIDLADAFGGIADVFDEMTTLFDIDPKDLGFVQDTTDATGFGDAEGETPSYLLGPEISEVTGIALNSDDIAKLASIGLITFETHLWNAQDEIYNLDQQTIDLTTIEPFDFYGNVIKEEESTFLEQLVAALNGETGLAGLGWAAVHNTNDNSLTFKLTGAGTASTVGSLSIKSATDRSDPQQATTLVLKEFGIRDTDQTNPVGSDVDVLRIQDGRVEVDLATLNTSTLFTMDTVRFVIAVDGVFQTVDVDAPPIGGWGTTDLVILDNLVTQFNTAMDSLKLNLVASTNSLGDGLKFALKDPSIDQNIQIALDPESLTRAFSMKGLAVWFQEAFAQIDCMPEFELKVNFENGDGIRAGDIILGFTTPIEKVFESGQLIDGKVDPSTTFSLDIDDIGLGDLQGVNLQAELEGSITASVDMAAGFNILDIQTQYKKSFAATPDDDAENYGLTAGELDDFENNREFASKIKPVLLDNTFLTDLKFNAVLDATVSGFEGEASMGMIGIGIGTGTPASGADTFARLNTELVIDLVGQSEGAFSNRISGTQLLSLASGQVIDGYIDPNGVEVDNAPLNTRTYEDPDLKYTADLSTSTLSTATSGTDRDGDDTRLISITSNNGTPEDQSDDIVYTVQRNAEGEETGKFIVNDVEVDDLPVYTPVLGPAPAGARFVDLLGKVELIGGILVDTDGCALVVDDHGLLYDPNDIGVDTDGTLLTTGTIADDLDLYTADDTFIKNSALTNASQLVIHNGDDRHDGQTYSMLQLNFKAPEIRIGEVTSGGGLDDVQLQMTVGDLFDIANTTQLCTDVEKLLCLALVDPNLLLEGVAGFGLLLEGFVDNLEKNFPVLNTEVPLLNGTLLEQFDFIGDFNDGLEEAQAAGGLSFENINALFADAFGQDVLTLELNTDGGACELLLGLELNFLDDFELTESFNLSLSSLLGEDGLNQVIGDAGASDELEGVFSSLVDARGDAELVIDPALNLNFHLGLDLMTLKESLLGGNLRGDVVEATPLNDLSTVAMLTTNGLGSVDLRIDWADEDIILGDFVPASTVAPVVQEGTVPKITPGAFSLLLDFDKFMQDKSETILAAIEAGEAVGLAAAADSAAGIVASAATAAAGNPNASVQNVIDAADQAAVTAETDATNAKSTAATSATLAATAAQDLATAAPADAVAAELLATTTAETAETDAKAADVAEHAALAARAASNAVVAAAAVEPDDGEDPPNAADVAAAASEVAATTAATSTEAVTAANAAASGLGVTVDELADLEPNLTVGELVIAINAELTSLIGAITETDLKARLTDNVRIVFEAASEDDPTMKFKLVDDLSDKRDDTGMKALFGETPQSDDGGEYVDPPVVPYEPRKFALEATPDYTSEYKFAIQVGDGPAVDVVIEEEENRNQADFIKAFNRVLLDISVGRDQISDTALVATTVPLSQLFRVVLDAGTVPGTTGTVKLITTNFAQNNGYDEFEIKILGNDVAHNVTFTVSEEENSNAARLLGFGGGFLFDGEATFEGNAESKDLFLANTTDQPIIYIDTEKTGIAAELGVGVPGGLNVIVNLGPFEASIEDGSVFIGASGEGNERGYVRGVIADIDKHPDDGRYDLLNLYTLSQEDDPDFLKLFGLEMDFETRVDLPFSGAFGLLDPSEHGFKYVSTLLRTQNVGGEEGDLTANASDINAALTMAQIAKGSDPLTALERVDALLPFFRGDAKEIYRAAVAAAKTVPEYVDDPALSVAENAAAKKLHEAAPLRESLEILKQLAESSENEPLGTPYNDQGAIDNLGYFAPDGEAPFGPHYIALSLPDLPGCDDLLDLINNPLAVVNGLDMVLGTIQDFVTDAFSGLDLPIVGNNLLQGAQFFSDLRYDVIDGARDYLETPVDHDNDEGTATTTPTPRELPTTLDLVNTFMNEALDTLLAPLAGATDMTARFQMDVYENDTDADHPALYGGLVLDYTVFEKDLDVGFALDIPGLNLEVDDASKINFLSTLNLDLGFGLDCNGFFLLNKFDDGTNSDFKPEVAFEIKASLAADAEVEMNIGGVLEVTAAAKGGDDATKVVATLGLDLFGEAGFDHVDGSGKVERTYDFDEERLKPLGLTQDKIDAGELGITPLEAAEFNRMLYISQIDFNDFADVSFDVDINVDLDMTVGFDGVSAVPKLLTNFLFEATYNPEVNAKDLAITEFEFHEISLDIASLKAVFTPIIDPIKTLIGPVKSMIDAMDVMPFSFFIDAFKSNFPIFNVIGQLDAVITSFDQLTSNDTEKPLQICIGTYDFIGVSTINLAEIGKPPEIETGVFLTEFSISNAIFRPCFNFDFDLSFGGAVQGPGVTFKIPLLQDPTNALNMMLGRFDKVDLARVEINLLTANANLDVKGQILSNIGIPGWVGGAFSGFSANVNGDLKAAIEFGYDLSGVVNFANTLDPERLLDGIFIDPDLLKITVSGAMGVSAYIAGASGSISADLDLDIRDPNSDGKIRLPELLYILDSFGNQSGLENKLGALFNGSVSMSAALRFWAGINLPWPLPDLSWSKTLFDTTIFNYSLPAPPPAPVLTTALGSSGFHMLNAGAQAGANMTSLDFDGNDTITIDSSNNVSHYSSNGQNYTGSATLGSKANNLVISAGKGVNDINLSAMLGKPNTITYLGDQNDTIKLADDGVHVVFAGDGNDDITIGTSGTYYIFGEGGADIIKTSDDPSGDLTGSAKVYVFSDDDFGMRKHFQNTFSAKAGSSQTIEGQFKAVSPSTTEPTNFKVSGQSASLSTLTEDYTRVSQSGRSTGDDTVTLNGLGEKHVFTGSGADKITITADSLGGVTKVYSGAGDDEIKVNKNNTTYVEAGAGNDLVVLTGTGSSTIYGWGAQAEVLGTVNSISGVKIHANDARLHEDNDVIVGGSGADTIYGQYGNDILSGQAGDDVIYAGADDDIASGGVLEVSTVGENGAAPVKLSLSTAGVLDQLDTALIVETNTSAADGADEVYGGAGSDVLLGGSNQDTLGGGSSSDIVVGDYGKISVSANRIAQTFTSTGVDQAGGTDVLEGNGGNDILVGGAGSGNDIELFTDLQGNNVVIGDFGIVEGNRILEAVKAYRAIASSYGSQDNITTGAGNDVIIGGEGSDTIDGGSGGDAIIGDLGSFVPSEGTITNQYYNSASADVLLSNTAGANPAANEGNDEIRVGLDSTTPIESDLFDIILGGGGGDTITGGIGGMVVVGDYGNIQLNSDSVRTLFSFIPRETPPAEDDPSPDAISYRERIKTIERIFESVTSLDSAGNALGDGRSGNDSITTAGGTVYSVLGGGNDTVDLGNGLSYIVTDDGEMAIIREKDANDKLPPFGTVKGFSVSTSGAGADFVTTRQDRDIIITGDGNDTINAGDGRNFVLADNGSLETSDDTEALPKFLKNTAGQGDGADVYTGGSGTDYVIMGGGSDTANGGAGRNFILGDSGVMEFEGPSLSEYTATLTSNDIVADHYDGDDTFTGADGENFIIAGLGDSDKTTEDKVTFLGNGNNTIMTNAGSFQYTLNADGSESIVSTVKPLTAVDQDGNDSVETGGGRDIVALGLGSDTADLGEGDNFALGGAGKIELGFAATGSSTVRLTSEAISTIARDGDDKISAGEGRDIVALGMGNDTADLGNGDNFALGGAGDIELLLEPTGAQTIRLTAAELSSIAQDGNDSVTSGLGRDVVALGMGSDFANLGNGNNYALGGAGEINLQILASGDETVRLTSSEVSMIAKDGNDTVETGEGRDVVALGLGADFATLGNGINFALGDAGEIALTLGATSAGVTGAQNVRIQSAVTSTLLDGQDGNDTVNTGDDDDFIVLGLGDDVGNFGNGSAFGVGSDGTVIYEQAAGTSAFKFEIKSNDIVDSIYDGNDTINAQDGNDYIILGLGDDLANVGDGRNRLIGDQGRISGGPLADVEEVQSTYLDLGGDDRVSSGKDEDIFVLGQGAEIADSGAGDDVLVGDNAFVQRTGTGSLHNLQVYTTGGGGDDSLNGGADNDIIIGSLGSDTLNAGSGEDFILGDLGDLTFRNDTDVVTLSYTTLDVGGDDVISATGSGDNILIGQAGADTISGGDDDDLVIGDLAEITLSDVRDAQDGQSALDRLDYLEFIGETLIYDDVLDGNTGSDFMIGGFGADTLNGGAGQDFMFGDSVQIIRTVDDKNVETLSMDTNFAYLTGGTDVLDGSTGNNIVVGGLGTDLFYGDTESQVLAGDAFAAFTRASFVDGFNGETPNRGLVTVNFAGPFAVDVLTYSQLEQSIGVFFSAGATYEAIYKNGYQPFSLSDETPIASSYTPATVAYIEAFFDQETTVTKLAELMYFRADADLISEEMLQLLTVFGGEVGVTSSTSHFELFKLLLQRVLDDLNAQEPEQVDEPQETDVDVNADARLLNQQEIAALQAVI